MPFGRRLPLVVLTLAVAASCQDVTPPAIGFTVSWGDGPLEAYMQEAVNRAAGAEPLRILGREVGSLEDLGTSALAAEVTRATRLAADPSVLVVVGPGGSREALQVAPIYRDAGVVNIAPTATSQLLPSAGPWTLRMAPNDSVQGAFMGAFADTSLHARRAAIFYVPDEYGIGLAKGVAAELMARGVTILERVPMRIAQECRPPAGDRAYYEALAAQLALRGEPDVVLIAARTVETGCLARSLRRLWPAVPVIAGDGAYLDRAFFETMQGEPTDDVFFVTYWHRDIPDSASRAFVAEFEKAVGRAPRHGDAIFYDAVMLAAAAVRAAGNDREAVRRWLLALGTTQPAYDGIAGPVSFAPDRRRTLLMTRVVGSGSVVVGTR